MLITSVLNQKVYPGAGDVDDCWVVSSIQAVHAHWPSLWYPTVTSFRKAAGDPDDGVNDGGSLNEIEKGIHGCWLEPELIILREDSWEDFESLIRLHKIATVAIVSGSLPVGYRFGFNGLHQITVEVWEDNWYIANPLAPQGSAPQKITEANLQKAMLDYGNGSVYGVIIKDPEVQPVNYITTTILPFGGRLTIPANQAVTGIQLDALTGTVSAVKTVLPSSTPQTYNYDATVITNITRGNPFLRVTSGPLAGWLLTSGAADEVPNVDATDKTQSDIDAAVKAATDPLKAALLAEQAEDKRVAGVITAALNELTR